MTADGDGVVRRELVPGRSTLWWARVGLYPLAGTMVTLVVLVVVLLAWPPGEDGSAAVTGVLVALVVTGATAIVCLLGGMVQDLREMRAGYTTAFAWHRDVDQVDPVTGEVVRRAGEPLITRRTSRLVDARRVPPGGPDPQARHRRRHAGVCDVRPLLILAGLRTQRHR